ncbi:MAG: HAMP domain-containing sensor histidine kinase [Cyclobacteriaceae bacterium]
MKINKYTLTGLLGIVVVALIVLITIQFNIIEKDIKNNQSVMEFSLPGILSDLYNNMRYNKEWQKYTEDIDGTREIHFTRHSEPTDPVQSILKTELDQVLSLNYPELDYQLDGFQSSTYGCMIHRNHRPELPKAQKVLDAENHLCFCGILRNTFDISLTYTNKEEAAIGKSAQILQTSLLLILVILSAFAYTIYTISKQKKLSDLKRDFINNLTHEFKTPIFSISLAAKSLKENEPIRSSEKMSSYADLIGSETKRLQTQVDKILQMALLDSGNLTLDKKKLDLHESIQNVAESFDMLISQRSGKITLSLQAANHTIVADETHLNNILYNLIDNAQKYSEGPPIIEVSTEDQGEQGILLVIKDHGIGIEKKVQKYVFDQFYRAEQGDVHTVKGFGLGLSYVKRIIEFHQGTVALKSNPGKGSEFKIFLPQA